MPSENLFFSRRSLYCMCVAGHLCIDWRRRYCPPRTHLRTTKPPGTTCSRTHLPVHAPVVPLGQRSIEDLQDLPPTMVQTETIEPRTPTLRPWSPRPAVVDHTNERLTNERTTNDRLILCVVVRVRPCSTMSPSSSRRRKALQHSLVLLLPLLCCALLCNAAALPDSSSSDPPVVYCDVSSPPPLDCVDRPSATEDDAASSSEAPPSIKANKCPGLPWVLFAMSVISPFILHGHFNQDVDKNDGCAFGRLERWKLWWRYANALSRGNVCCCGGGGLPFEECVAANIKLLPLLLYVYCFAIVIFSGYIMYNPSCTNSCEKTAPLLLVGYVLEISLLVGVFGISLVSKHLWNEGPLLCCASSLRCKHPDCSCVCRFPATFNLRSGNSSSGGGGTQLNLRSICIEVTDGPPVVLVPGDDKYDEYAAIASQELRERRWQQETRGGTKSYGFQDGGQEGSLEPEIQVGGNLV